MLQLLQERSYTMALRTGWFLAAALWFVICGCSHNKTSPTSNTQQATAAKQEEAEAGEVKLPLEQTPQAVQKTIQKEMAGGDLEDIAKIQHNGKTIYETDYSKNGAKYELWVAD